MANLTGLYTQATEPEGMLEDYTGLPGTVVRFAERVYTLMGKEAAIGIQRTAGTYAIWRFEVRGGKQIYTRLREVVWELPSVDILPPPVVGSPA